MRTEQQAPSTQTATMRAVVQDVYGEADVLRLDRVPGR